MCFGRPPSPPPLPEPRPTPPKPERTADRVVVGDDRTRPAPASVTGQQTTGETGRKRTGQRQQRARRLGTRSLRIPLLKKSNTTEDLNI